MLLWLLHHLTALWPDAWSGGGVGEDHAARRAGRRRQLRRGRAAGAAVDRAGSAAASASRSRAIRRKSPGCTATNSPRRRWAGCSSSPRLLASRAAVRRPAKRLSCCRRCSWPCGMTLVGIVDDLVKLRSAANGISARCKLAAQLVVAGVAAVLLYQQQAAVPDGLLLRLPLVGQRRSRSACGSFRWRSSSSSARRTP